MRALVCRPLCNHPLCHEPLFLSSLKLRTLPPVRDVYLSRHSCLTSYPLPPTLPLTLHFSSNLMSLFNVVSSYSSSAYSLAKPPANVNAPQVRDVYFSPPKLQMLPPVGTFIFLPQNVEGSPCRGRLFLSLKTTKSSPCRGH